MIQAALLTLLIIWAVQPVFAHGGGLNAQGCHNNRKTGGYHCHRAQTRSPSTAPRINDRPLREWMLEYGSICNEVCRQPEVEMPKSHAMCKCALRRGRE